ncbi:hypothetical protein SAMN02745121_08286 [Nannocystis exedens]|uniref:Uncharacterized protein n=1 Tax=Nannocystis exedens TaxID=54 RepID=A0A1I2HYL5_9BACT|nr:hypothetical protein [Nannocystis exedens]PCC66402.1 hypothetical protein NAEX_08990 [Nannocystis exedens]SFF34538.1 hypothetical protein SAMN02745121_08286 [Nannocystis exedens]
MSARAFGLVVGIAVAGASLPVHAQGPGAPATAPAPAPASTPEPRAAPAQDAGKQDPPAPGPDAEEPVPETRPDTAPPAGQAELVAPPNNVSQSAGLGSAVATTDPEAKRAKAELEGTALRDKPVEGVPERLPPLQRAGWWCVFGGFALASTGGVFAGLAETEEDKAARLIAQIDPETGASLQYADVKGEYDDILARGRRDAVLARSFLIAGGAVLAAAIGLFIADRVKRRPARVQAGLGGLQVRF